FFFQSEDGIRYFHVTGVQTCALPISSWKQRQPDDVRVTLLAAPFGGFWMPYAKAYYAAEALGIAEATHRPMFDAIHRQRELPVQIGRASWRDVASINRVLVEINLLGG